MADTAAALVIQLSADFRDFKKQMQQATGVFDTEGKKIAKKQADLKKKLSDWTLDFTGLKGLGGVLAGLTAVGVATGISELVKHSLEAAAAISNIAQQAGVTTDFLQKMRFASAQTGGSFDTMDEALTQLNRNFGEFVNSGGGRAAQSFKTLGIDKLITSGDVRNTEQAFNAIVKKVSSFSSEAQKGAFMANFFGREAGPKMLQLINQGADGISNLERQAVSLGIVLSGDVIRGAKEANDKLDTLFSVIKAEGIAAIANLAPEIANLAQKITDGLPDLVLWVEKWADFFGLIKLDPVQSLAIQVADATASLVKLKQQREDVAKNPTSLAALLGPGLDEFDTLIAADQAKLDKLKQSLKDEKDFAPVVVTPMVKEDPRLHINDIEAQKKAEEEAKKAEELRLKRAQFLAQTVLDNKTAQAALLAASDDTNVQLLKGQAGYFNARKKQIEDDFNNEITLATAQGDKQLAEIAKQGKDWKQAQEARAQVTQEVEAKIATAGEKRAQALDEIGPDAFGRAAGQAADAQIRQFGETAAAIGLSVAATAKLAFVQGQLNDAREKDITLSAEQIQNILKQGDAVGIAAEAAHKAQLEMDKGIQVQDELRQGLEDIGAAGLQGFSNLADAAKNFVGQIAEMILRLYVLKPLLTGLLGDPGTSGTGALGGVLGKLLGGGTDLATVTTQAIAANPLLFDEGGYTGPGAKNKIGGLVHKGEVVWSQADIRRAGGVSVVEAMRRGMGYANGGVVGIPNAPYALPKTPHASVPHRNIPSLVLNIDARYATKGVSEQIRDELTRSYPLLVRAAVQESDKKFPSNLSNNLRDRA